jgi:hypothetical protein
MSAQANFDKIKSTIRSLKVHERIEVDRELAGMLLTLNTDNRPVYNATVKRYAETMERNEWSFTGDNICITRSGKLINGQHRLMAIVRSGKTQLFNIQTGLEDEAFDVMDIGKNRTASDALSIKGFKYFSILPGAIRIITTYDAMRLSKDKQIPDSRVVRLSNRQVVEWMEKHDGRQLETYCEIASRMFQRAKFISTPTYAAFLYIFGRKDRDDALFFFDTFSTGENISRTEFSPVYLLRQKFINWQQSRMSATNQADKWAYIIKAWNFYRRKEEIKVLQYNPDREDYPIAI